MTKNPSPPRLSSLSESDIVGKTVLLRAALNVPIDEDGGIENDYRLQATLPTVKWLTNRGARVILISHRSEPGASLEPVYEHLRERMEITFIREYQDGVAGDFVDSMKNGDIALFENLRLHAGEKENDTDFARNLASYADIFVNESFDVAHREHASVVGVPELLPSFAGLRFVEEVEQLSRALEPEHPFVFILGGAKFATKLPLVEKFTAIADSVFVGGALANVYLKAAGHPVGSSRLPEASFDVSAGLASSALQLPTDVVVQSEAGMVGGRSVEDVGADELVVDLGEQSVRAMIDAVKGSTMVVWNGPLGWYEKGFSEGTDRLAKVIAEADATSILGGGDTAAVILKDMQVDDFSFVSTAGGAMIDYLANETLPGIKALY